ncbi:uncharacterized protein LOC111641585 [Centruroides sculpturatus]|uniref:uncharacterized protein LOC111641585 n=1 Tax=Centruroides sculpturatus TaxID=218467 RepID=UPI000C6DC434|nr:uncharacterized protein LOC111641585 [Centruroides sculpturatus]
MIWQRLRLCPVIYLLIWIAQGIHYRDDEVDHIYVQVGHNVTIQCREVVDAKTVHRIEWWKEDKKIVDIQGEHKSTWEAASHVSILPNTYTLYFRRVRTEDSGEYSCAVNGKRRKDGVVKLFVQGEFFYYFLLSCYLRRRIRPARGIYRIYSVADIDRYLCFAVAGSTIDRPFESRVRFDWRLVPTDLIRNPAAVFVNTNHVISAHYSSNYRAILGF